MKNIFADERIKIPSTPLGPSPLFDAWEKATRLSLGIKFLLLFKRKKYYETTEGLWHWLGTALFSERR